LGATPDRLRSGAYSFRSDLLVVDEVVRRNNALASSGMVEVSRCGFRTKRRSDLKEEASDLRRSEAAAKIQDRGRER
jgi:hypothetical protein